MYSSISAPASLVLHQVLHFAPLFPLVIFRWIPIHGNTERRCDAIHLTLHVVYNYPFVYGGRASFSFIYSIKFSLSLSFPSPLATLPPNFFKIVTYLVPPFIFWGYVTVLKPQDRFLKSYSLTKVYGDPGTQCTKGK